MDLDVGLDLDVTRWGMKCLMATLIPPRSVYAVQARGRDVRKRNLVNSSNPVS